MITTITGKNQVTIPAELARREGLRPGTRLEWRATERPHILEVRVLRARRHPGSPVDRLVRERQDEDHQRGGT